MADGMGGDSLPAIKHWLRFCVAGRGVSPRRDTTPSSPLEDKVDDETLLIDFAIWLVTCAPSGQRISVKTASGYVGTVRRWHKRRFNYDIGGDLDLSNLRDTLKGMRRQINAPAKRKRYGVRPQDLAKAKSKHFKPSASDSSAEAIEKLNWDAALTTGFCGLMRAAEFSLQANEELDYDRALTRADLEFAQIDGHKVAIVMMRPAKNGRHVRGKTVPVILRSGTILDPVKSLWDLVQGDPVPESEKATTPLFRTRLGGSAAPLRVPQVRAVIRALMSSIGLDPRLYGAHSLRIGGATAALAAGIHPAQIRLLGRWNSDLWEIYTRATLELASSVATAIGSTPFHDIESGFHTEQLETLQEEAAVAPEFGADEDGMSSDED